MDPLSTAVAILKALYEIYTTLDKLTHPDPASIADIYHRLVSLEFQVVYLEHEVENTAYELRRAEVIEITRAVDSQRAASNAATAYSIDHPGDTADEITALAAASALASPSFYIFAGRTAASPDRFDPRAALPTFIQAVINWLSIRRLNSSAWTPTSKASLSGFATRLDNIVGQIRGSVQCIETYGSYDHPLTPPPHATWPPRKRDPGEDPPPPPPTEPMCSHIIACMDMMRETTEYPVKEATKGYCGRDGSFLNTYETEQYLNKYYMPNSLAQIAQSWHAMAT